jgi:hypothetical protein
LRFETLDAKGTLPVTPRETTVGLPARIIGKPQALAPVVVLTTENRLLQLWEGHVTSVAVNEFSAVIRDKTDPTNPDEEVSIALEELGADDLELVRPGAVFYWSVRYEQEIGLARRRVSRIRFRRLPGWSHAELKEVDSFVQKTRHIWADDAADGTTAST